MATYQIKYGDTLSGIAKSNNTDVNTLMSLNPYIKDPNKIYAGNSLNLPTVQPAKPVQSTVQPTTQPTVQATTNTQPVTTQPVVQPTQPIQNNNGGNPQTNAIISGEIPNYSFPAINVPQTSEQYKSEYSDAINQIANQILNMRFSYNPEEDDLLQQATQYATQNTFESMNSKGILNSSMTAERVAKVVSDLIPQYENMARQEFEASFSRMINVANLIMNMDDRSFTIWKDARDQKWKEQEATYSKLQDSIQNAWERIDQLGYVDNESALILNIPAGTLSKDAREAKEAYERQIEEWNRQHEIEVKTEKELLKLKNQLQTEEWNRQHQIEVQTEKELLQFKNELAKDEYQAKLQMEAMYGGNNANTVDLSDYDAIVKNRFVTKNFNDQYEVTDNDALWNYLKGEYESGRLSENDALTIISKYNVVDPADKLSDGAQRWYDSLVSIENSRNRKTPESELRTGLQQAINQGALTQEEAQKILKQRGYN